MSAGSGKRPHKPAADRRADIVEGVLDLVAWTGPAQVTTAAVAQAVGLSEAGVFRHFGSMAAIWEAVIAAAYERLSAAWREAAATPAPPRQALGHIVEAYLREVSRRPGIIAVISSPELMHRYPTLGPQLRASADDLVAILDELIAAGQARGEIDPALDPTAVRRQLYAVMRGLLDYWLVAGGSFDVVAEGRNAFATLVTGIAPRDAPVAGRAGPPPA